MQNVGHNVTNVLLNQVLLGSPGAPTRYQREHVETACCRTSRLGSSKQDLNSWTVCQQIKASGHVTAVDKRLITGLPMKQLYHFSHY